MFLHVCSLSVFMSSIFLQTNNIFLIPYLFGDVIMLGFVVLFLLCFNVSIFHDCSIVSFSFVIFLWTRNIDYSLRHIKFRDFHFLKFFFICHVLSVFYHLFLVFLFCHLFLLIRQVLAVSHVTQFFSIFVFLLLLNYLIC